MTRFKNARKDAFIEAIATASIDAADDRLTEKCKFNFAYFHVQEASQAFEDWSGAQLAKLLNKLTEYSKQPLAHWKTTSVGKSGTVLSIYGAFPTKSDFSHPKHVPHQAEWGRFRLESAVRLVGFVVPHSHHEKRHPATNHPFDCNTFYVVFLDKDHKFYKTESA